MLKYPEFFDEVLTIEKAIVKLSSAMAPNTLNVLFQVIKERLGLNDVDSKVILLSKPKINWFAYSGWAASIVLTSGLIRTLMQNNNLEHEIIVADTRKEFLELQIEKAQTNLAEAQKLVSVLRDKDIVGIPLDGQSVSPNSFAKVYWNKTEKNIYLDVQGLPGPPEGKVY